MTDMLADKSPDPTPSQAHPPQQGAGKCKAEEGNLQPNNRLAEATGLL